MSAKKKQTVIKLDINCVECQREIFAKVGKIKGVQSLAVDPEKRTLTVVGNVEPVPVFKALKKIKKNPEILTVGAPKPKCPYCKYFVCSCGIARFPAKQPTELAPPPPGWRVPPPCTEDSGWCQPPITWGSGWGPTCSSGRCPTSSGGWGPMASCGCCPPPPCDPLPSWCPLPPSTPYPSYLPPRQHCELVALCPASPDERPGQCSIM